MKKGVFLVYDSLNMEKPSGIEKKILSQIKLFDFNNISMEIKRLDKESGTFWNYEVSLSNYDFIYFRRSTIIDARFIGFFKKIKRDNPKVKIMMEIPTFPYEGEYRKNFKNRISLCIDRYFREKLVGIIDYIVIVGQYQDTQIWGVKAIQIVNGIDVATIPIINKVYDEKITISCIAKFSPWHGYERLINGLAEYYKNAGNRCVQLIMVGDGIESEKYKDLVSQYDLGNQVLFTGLLTGSDLDEVYQKTDIGCCSLGRYKSGLDVIGDLKSREFMAKGIPMILGCDIDILQGKEYKYAIQFPNNGTNIDIEKVLTFYDNLTLEYSAEELRKNIRKTAYEYADIKKTFRPVIDTCIKCLT